ncbi:hypothetical protein CJ232_03980 [Hoylesella timonensis]|uniref:Uncharacterized protein n=1 Tax=Hoylesella timonensis TaxID=386414 RepID=A0A2N6Q6N7_9BACT|nr:hypothetical protein CJ232_03980 [Hoylesella timonensis]
MIHVLPIQQNSLFPILGIFTILDKSISLFLSYYFTKKRPFKIFKIEKINRQTTNKNALI